MSFLPLLFFFLSLFHSLLSRLLLLLTIFVCKLSVEQFDVDNVVFDALLPIVLFDVEHKVVVELNEIHSLDVRFVVHDVVVHIFDANVLLNNS